MKEIALVTYREKPKLEDGEALLVEELRRRNWKVAETPWDDMTICWEDFGVVVLRAAWNYYGKLKEFRSWLGDLKNRGINFWNPIEIVEWNIDKHYLDELRRKGIPTIPTVFVDRGQKFDLKEILEGIDGDEIIVKPVIGASAHGIGRFNRENVGGIKNQVTQLLVESGVMIQ